MRIQIIGAAGSGKSTLGRYLSRMLGLPLLESDHYLWADRDFRQMRPPAVRREMLARDLSDHPDFILTGSVHAWDAAALPDIDLLVLLRLDDALRMERLIRREEAYFGARCRPGGDHHAETAEFIAWARTYLTADGSAGNSLAAHQSLLSEARCPCRVLDAARPVEALAEQILAALPSRNDTTGK